MDQIKQKSLYKQVRNVTDFLFEKFICSYLLIIIYVCTNKQNELLEW